MRRNLPSVFKFLLLSAVTVLFTVVIFRLVKLNTKRPPYAESGNYNGLPVENEEKESLVASNEKIDWHDYSRIKRDSRQKGPGEQGVAAYLGTLESDNYDKLFKVNGFNAAVSDKIRLDRSLPDIRHKGCQKKKYLKRLPTVSVIVPFHNEHWTTLLRTATSVVNRSPAHLLKEVILVDDFSSKEFSKKPLDDYLAANLTKVRSIHLPKRSGLIRARMAGARAATADVLIFLDSHTEANVNWLPPLLEPIAQDYRTCVCPFIDVINFETFAYGSQDEGARGAFDWEFFYKRLPLLPEDKEHPTEPFKSPVMAGGLFAISTRFFWELEGYDEGLEIWGGEQYELSFKIWQCGGQMVDAPCSRVGHIYRKFAPFPNPGIGDFVGRNYRRVADVWMDEYAEYLYKRRPHYRDLDPGDLTKQKSLRARLRCKPFAWFMQKVAFDLPLKYPPVEPPDFGFGAVRSLAAPELCLDAMDGARDRVLELGACAAHAAQNFTLTWHKDVRVSGKTVCLDVSEWGERAPVVLYPCHGSQGNQYWRYDVERQWFMHGGNPRCLDADLGRKRVFVGKCEEGAKTQRWRFEHVDLTALADWENVGAAVV